MEENKVKELIDEIRIFIKEFKKNTNGKISKISNKDLLFYFISKCSELDKRMDDIEKEQTATKTSIKNLLIFVSVVCSVLGVLGYLGL